MSPERWRDRTSHFEAYIEAAAVVHDDEQPSVPPHLAVTFDPPARLPKALRAEIEAHAWEVPAADAWPWPLTIDEDMDMGPPTARELAVAEALAFALSVWTASDASAGDDAARSVSVQTHGGPVTVTLRVERPPFDVPAEGVLAELYELEEEDRLEERHALVAVRTAGGRRRAAWPSSTGTARGGSPPRCRTHESSAWRSRSSPGDARRRASRRRRRRSRSKSAKRPARRGGRAADLDARRSCRHATRRHFASASRAAPRTPTPFRPGCPPNAIPRISSTGPRQPPTARDRVRRTRPRKILERPGTAPDTPTSGSNEPSTLIDDRVPQRANASTVACTGHTVSGRRRTARAGTPIDVSIAAVASARGVAMRARAQGGPRGGTSAPRSRAPSAAGRRDLP